MNFRNHLLCLLVITTPLLSGLISQVEGLNFNFSHFPKSSKNELILTPDAEIDFDAIQVTHEARGASITNLSGRVWYKQKLRIWSKQKNITASFNSTFVLNITPQTNPGGEGLAFILSKETGYIPENSHGEWLGIVNSSTNGSSQSNIFAVEFDTKKSYAEDIDDNHVGIDLNSIYSTKQVSLYDHGVNVSSGSDVTTRIQYDGESKVLTVYVFMTSGGGNQANPILTMPLDLSNNLPEDVFVGFSASTGESTQLNCIKSWNFTSTVVDDDAVDLLWVWILIPVTLAAVVIGFSFYFKWNNKRREVEAQDEDQKVEIKIMSSTTAPKKFRLKELKQATGNFNSKNKLGRGGCGTVYKGLLDNTENLVKLVGWCHESNELLLVYELMPNGSLDKLIFPEENANPEDGIMLSWETRHGIICGVAGALDYLHNGCEKRVLHRDIKASNIMLDSEFNARLGDFGLARTIPHSDMTHHSTKKIAGTLGYMPPESFHIGRATAETDIYAFGVLLLEVSCGRKPGYQSDENNYSNGIVDWVWELHNLERILEVMDMRLSGNFDRDQAESVLKLGLACCHPNPYQRPSMRTALQVFTGEVAPPPIPNEKPAFVWPAMAPITDD
ncbi:concanavalin A-like lectin protein kinase family protein [Actinidia rufa]|uniref:Concanavalin A-like lectin protein kinase family protein n=1 Tax=Actinidia rufa TaxID=165716 RepID=A0A7J0E2L6_9ERIC|nr:concanavalin A-like lectin protein kinase family protein [Actinidia rufa]